MIPQIGGSRPPYRNRADAGSKLVERLGAFADSDDTLVIGLPRGGVPVAAEVADALGLPLDILSVRKLGVPENEELAMGAVATGNVIVLDEEVIDACGVSHDDVEREVERKWHELRRREEVYRQSGDPIPVDQVQVILVDDGAATGSTLLSAIRSLRRRNVSRVVVALPVASSSAIRDLQREADEVICVVEPHVFRAVGEWYEEFGATSNEEVVQLLGEARRRSERYPSSSGTS